MRRRPSFDFVGRSRLWFTVSGAIMLLSVLALAVRGLNLSIEFVGGSSFTVSGIDADVTSDQLEDAAVSAGAAIPTAQLVRDGAQVSGAIVRTAAIEPGSDVESAVADALREVGQADNVEVSFVGPTWGERISRKMLEALVVFLIVVVAYISVRLEFKMSVAALVALFHDIVLTAGVYSLFQFNVSPATVIALLTILGYSLYDTAIVFDRIKENTARLGRPGLLTYSGSVNTSMNEVLQRSINTTITSILPVGALLFIGAQALGATTLQDLAIALFVGLATGAYSSLFIAGPFLARWKEHEPEMQRLALRAERREERAGDTSGDGETEPAAADRHEPLEPRGYVRGPGRKPRSQR
ncbi:MAG: protein translocase subunit SecF [Actinobacteria bacterium]|nr:protein translocase subunit SecF [Actinomycetota bacterium]